MNIDVPWNFNTEQPPNKYKDKVILFGI